MNIKECRSKTTPKSYISVNFDSITAEEFYTLLLDSLTRKERRYASAVSRLKKTDKYYGLAVYVLKRTQKHILEVESAYYEYTCKMQDRLAKGNIKDDETD